LGAVIQQQTHLLRSKTRSAAGGRASANVATVPCVLLCVIAW